MSKSIQKKNTLLNIIIIASLFIIILIGYNIYLKISRSENIEVIEYQNSTGKIIQVEVLNATEVKGLADKFTKYLREKKFDVVRQGNYSQKMEYSQIIDRLGNEQNARNVARALKIDYKRIVREIKPDSLLDVTIIIGNDYNQLLREKSE